MPVKAGQQHLELGDRVEHGLLVLLQVAVVRERQALERGEQAGEVADQAARLAARELGDVGVLLLRHDRRPGRERVVQLHEAELARRPEDDLLGEAREVDADLAVDEGELGDDVAARGRVDRVLGGARRSRARSRRAAGRARASCRRGRRRRRATPMPARDQSRRRSRSRTSGQACASRWCASSTGCACCRWVRPGMTARRVRRGLRGDRVDELDHESRDRRAVVTQVEAHERGDLVVAAAARAELAAELGAGDADEPALEGGVHVLVGLRRDERARRRRRASSWSRAAIMPVELAVVEVAGRRQGPGVRPGPGDVVRARAASRTASTRLSAASSGGGTGGEAAAPQGARLPRSLRSARTCASTTTAAPGRGGPRSCSAATRSR